MFLEKSHDGKYGFKEIEGTLPDGRRVLIIWRNVSENIIESNAALDAYFTKNRINIHDNEYDIIYVNCDNNLQNLYDNEECTNVKLIETEFKNRMFEEE